MRPKVDKYAGSFRAVGRAHWRVYRHQYYRQAYLAVIALNYSAWRSVSEYFTFYFVWVWAWGDVEVFLGYFDCLHDGVLSICAAAHGATALDQ